jgi:methyltransferase (TIGR00027 family)/uncharacterized protein (TIGR02118 family)
MIKMSMFYPNEEGKTFDKEYFMKTHKPLAEKAWGTALKKIEIEFGMSGQGAGVPPPYIAIISLYFDSIEAIQASIGPQHRELAQQTACFTAIQPIMQLSMVATDHSADDTIEEKPSQTAAYVALCRALSFRDERSDIKGPDSMAHLFLSEDGKKTLKDADSIRRGISFGAPIFGMLVARTAFFDAKFKEALSSGIQQIVLLGAGYDTRAYRFSSMLNDARVYELDISSTQNRKRNILLDAHIEIPPQVKFVSINFKNEKISDVLLKNGFNRSAPTLFLWEGVTYYLTETVFRETLTLLKSFAAKGSAVCFDFQTIKRESGRMAEPFQFWIKPEALCDSLLAEGFTIVEHLDPMEMEKRYLSLADGSIAEKAFEAYCFVHARM